VSTQDLVSAFYERLWNHWDDDLVPAVLHPELEFRGSLGTTTTGLAQWRAYRDGVRRGSLDFHNEVVELVDGGDRAAARLRWSGTHTGDLAGHAATGRRFAYEGAAFLTAEGGLLRQIWVVGDLDALRSALSEE
jgi:predicted ester cyclase